MQKNEVLIWDTPEEMDLKLAGRIRKLRKRRNWSRQKLADISGVSSGTIKRFENSGKITLLAFTKLVFALDAQGELRELLSRVPYRDIQEVINEQR